MILRHIFLIALFVLFFPTSILAQDHTTEERVAERLQAQYSSMKSLSFLFYQQTEGSVSGRPQIGEGEAIFLKSDQGAFMRWDYLAPAKQVLTSDGVVFSMYFEDLNQMIVTPAETLESDITYSFFIGKGDIKNDFIILPPEPNIAEAIIESSPSEIIKLIPKKEQSQVQDIHLWVNEASLITRIQIQDHFGTTTVLSFSAIDVDNIDDSSISRQRFNFAPPAGTEIIEQ